MFSLSISVTPEAIDSIKSDLTKTLFEVKSSHRVEALARGLGFSTYASMLAASKNGSSAAAAINWDEADKYLKDHDFIVPAEPFFIAVGRVAIQQLLIHEVRLTMDGMGISAPKRLPNGKWEDHKEYTARFQASRAEFLGDQEIKQFLRALAFVSRIQPIKTINKHISSYGLKHMAEKFACAYPDNVKLGPEYVANGALIAAALHAGFQYREYDGTPNVAFNMSQKSIDALYVDIEKVKRYSDREYPAAGSIVDHIITCSVTREDLEKALAAMEKMPPKDRKDITARSIKLISLFDEDRPIREIGTLISAIDSRLEAFAKIVDQHKIDDLVKPSEKKGALMLSQPLIEAIATEPLLVKGDRPVFNSDTFVKRACTLFAQAA